MLMSAVQLGRLHQVAKAIQKPLFLTTLMTASSSPVELQNADWRLAVDPAIGGSVMGLWMGEVPVLRPAPLGAAHAGQSAAYPLVPYSNRIGQGRMVWDGKTYDLRNGFNGEPHALHGVGFMRPWSVVEQAADSLCLRLVHQPDAFWPFAFEAEQRFELQADGLLFTFSARNTDTREQPMGLGWHPYFVRRKGATLDLPVHTQWLAGEDVLPREPLAVDGLHGAVADMRLDHCFDGAGSVAQMIDGELSVSLEADSRYWVVYTPVDADFYCVEPVTHLNNAVQQAQPLEHGLVAMPAGETLRQQVRLRGQRRA
jgi:aldose 1-epimerase